MIDAKLPGRSGAVVLEPLGGLALYKSHACVLLLIRNLFPLLSVTSRATCVGLYGYWSVPLQHL